jgi:uncharacterized protein YcaQ
MPDPHSLTPTEARRLWLAAQRLDRETPFGAGPEAVQLAVEHLGYVQIDTINVIERCHHHILFNRVPDYRRADLVAAQSREKTVFEYWTHALSFLPARDFPFYVATMKANRREAAFFASDVPRQEVLRVLKRVREEGALTISDIKDDDLVDKHHPWASRKPSKRALQRGFYNGELVIAARAGMLKTYELTERHFGWERLPPAASAARYLDYVLDRALRSQAVVSVDSVCYGRVAPKKAIAELIEKRVKKKALVPARIAGAEKIAHWAEPAALEALPEPGLVHILSPFDPLVIQRARTQMIFGYEHVFEAYIRPDKRRYGYFTLPVLAGEEIVAMLDLKTDRAARKVLIQSWHWTGKARRKKEIEAALEHFERFQLAN